MLARRRRGARCATAAAGHPMRGELRPRTLATAGARRRSAFREKKECKNHARSTLTGPRRPGRVPAGFSRRKRTP